MEQVQEEDYVAFSQKKRNINSLLSHSLETLRSLSRDVVRKNNYTANINDTIVSNCVGTGIKPQSKANDAEFRRNVQELWLSWADEADSIQIDYF